MSEFLFSDDHSDLEATVRTLATREFADGYLGRATNEAFPWTELGGLGDQHLLDMAVPEDLGGQGADPIALGIAVEQVARADLNISYLVFASLAAQGVLATKDPEMGRHASSEIMAGRAVCAGAFTEPRGGSDLANAAVRAERVAGGFLISGEKTSVTLGMHAREAVVTASTDRDLGPRGTRRFLVPLEDPSIVRQRIKDMGFIPLSRASLTFAGTFVPEERELLVAKDHDHPTSSAVASVLHAFDLSRPLIALMVLGAARRAMETTLDWVRNREAFGRAIAGFQGVSFTLAEHDTKLEAARWLAYRTLALRAAGKPHAKEAAMCKWWAPRLAVEAINDCIVLHGHVGWSAEMPLQQLLIDVSGLQIGDGTPQIQKLVIARELIGREYVG